LSKPRRLRRFSTSDARFAFFNIKRDIAKQLGYEAHSLPVEELDGRERFTVISMADVLEHMPFPKAGLAAAHRLLRQDADMENMVWRLLHANKVNPDGSTHGPFSSI
jgi:hypothetical protein